MELVLYRCDERAYHTKGGIVHKTPTSMVFRTVLGIDIRVEVTRSGNELDQYFDQGVPARVRVFQGQELLVENGYLLRPTDSIFLVIYT